MYPVRCSRRAAFVSRFFAEFMAEMGKRAREIWADNRVEEREAMK